MTGEPSLIGAEGAYREYSQGRVQFVDTRPAGPESAEHLPGAIHIDPHAGAVAIKALRALPRDKMIVAYGARTDYAASTDVALRARELGVAESCVLEGGVEGWRELGLPMESKHGPLEVDIGPTS